LSAILNTYTVGLQGYFASGNQIANANADRYC